MKPIIEVENLSKKFRIDQAHQSYLSIRDSFKNIFKRTSKEDFFALNNVNFTVNEGDSLGIIGRNGAGKSTLLKIISRITPPTSGSIVYRGRVASLLEVGTGFHGELTGRENVFMNGSILGMRKAEIKKNFEAIVDFAGVEKFIDTPLKHYSSGMQLRLAFAVAAFLENEILIIDEVLAVGDSEFQKKCIGKMDEVSKSGRTLLFVSHNMATIRQLSSKGILLQSGTVRTKGDIDDVIFEYQNQNELIKEYTKQSQTKSIYISKARVMGDTNDFLSNQDIRFSFEISENGNHSRTARLLVRIMDMNNTFICSCETPFINGKSFYELELGKGVLTKGNYKLHCILYQPAVEQFDIVDECCYFSIAENNKAFAHLETFDIGKVYIDQKWK